MQFPEGLEDSPCPECTVDSVTKTVFVEHLTQKHHFLFVYVDEYELSFTSFKFEIVQSVLLTLKRKLFLKNI